MSGSIWFACLAAIELQAALDAQDEVRRERGMVEDALAVELSAPLVDKNQ